MGNSNSIAKYLRSNPVQYATSLADRDDDVDLLKAKAYDYVIIGGGTAGCVLASRLTEDPHISVLLLEAGKNYEEYPTTYPPMGFTRNYYSSDNWNYTSTPQLALNNRNVYLPHGKVLGGTSSINGCIYHHGTPEDYEGWVRAGATGWTYEALKPYFLKAEKYFPPNGRPVRTDDRGDSGPWSTCDPMVAPASKYIIQACKALGIPENSDFNTPKGTLGVGNFMGFIDPRGRRSSAATAWLTAEVLQRPNLTVAIEAIVEKILISTSPNDLPYAEGVRLAQSQDGPAYVVRADKEVILSTGTFVSPQMLMVSGIGPRKQLERAGITVVKDLPAVGKNLYDHVSPGSIVFRSKKDITWDYFIHNSWNRRIATWRWKITGGGPIGALPSAGVYFVRSNDPKLRQLTRSQPTQSDEPGPQYPDIETFWNPFLAGVPDQDIPPGIGGLSVASIILNPASSGTVTIQSSSIWDKPIIDTNYFKEEKDMEVAIAALRLTLHVARTSPLSVKLLLKEHSTDKEDVFWPGDASPDLVTDDELKEWVKKKAGSMFHPTSTCRMGASAQTSVVDAQLKVYGVSSLRVIDASVFPKVVSGHSCAVVIALAERMADLLKAGHSKSI